MISVTAFGRLPSGHDRPERELLLVEAASVAELRDFPKLPSQHFICLVVWDAPATGDEPVRLAKTLLRAGAVFLSTFGRDCERVAETVDEVSVDAQGDGDDRTVLTTWHPQETLEEALWFALFVAFPAEGYEATTLATVVLSIGAPEHARSLRRCLADPQKFSDEHVASHPGEETSGSDADASDPPPAARSQPPAVLRSQPELAPHLGERRRAGQPRWRRAARLALSLVSSAGALIALVGLYCIPMPGQSWVGPLPRLTASEAEVAGQLREHVEVLASEIGPRRALHGDSLKRAEQYLRAALARPAEVAGSAVEREELGGAPGNPANLVLDLPGTKPGPLVLIGAHYDTDQHGTPGANDNASGTAAALVLAGRLAEARRSLPIRIVLFANEEQPYYATSNMGSLQHARGCRKRGELLRAMLSLETMGYYSDEPGSQRYPSPLSLFYPDRGNFIAFVGNLGSRDLVREAVGRFRAHATIPSQGGALPAALPGVGWSDHWSFWQEDYAAIMVTDTAPFRDPHYHRHSDVPTNLDFERLARVVVALTRVVLQLSNESP